MWRRRGALGVTSFGYRSPIVGIPTESRPTVPAGRYRVRVEFMRPSNSARRACGIQSGVP